MQTTIEELKKIIDREKFAESEKMKQQLELLSSLPGDHNQEVFDKLLELATHDPNAIRVFIEQFIQTSKELLEKE